MEYETQAITLEVNGERFEDDAAAELRARERPYPRVLFRTASTPVYAAGPPPRLNVKFLTTIQYGMVGDLLVRAWKRDLHEECAREAETRRKRREANGGAM